MRSIFERIIGERKDFYFVSPHIDDVIFSCGAFFGNLGLNRKNRLKLINVFTKGDANYKTSFNREYLKKCGFDNAEDFFEARKAEERLIELKTGASVVNLDFVDAGWRLRSNEMIFARNDSDLDPSLFKKIAERLERIIKGTKADSLIFLPVGVGGHIDHLTTRAVNRYFDANNIAYYAEFPYILRSMPDDMFVRRHNLTELSWNNDLLSKKELILSYVSQLPSIFTNKNIPLIGERFFFNRSSL